MGSSSPQLRRSRLMGARPFGGAPDVPKPFGALTLGEGQTALMANLRVEGEPYRVCQCPVRQGGVRQDRSIVGVVGPSRPAGHVVRLLVKVVAAGGPDRSKAESVGAVMADATPRMSTPPCMTRSAIARDTALSLRQLLSHRSRRTPLRRRRRCGGGGAARVRSYPKPAATAAAWSSTSTLGLESCRSGSAAHPGGPLVVPTVGRHLIEVPDAARVERVGLPTPWW